MRRYPLLYEINACLFVRRMSQKYGRPLTLAGIPDEEWRNLARRGFDLVWLMGVWQRSPGARQKALLHAVLRREYDRVLPGWTEEDIDGSPYAVYAYELNSALGKPAELAQLKSKLNRLGLGLILDFVSNHLALDHPWTRSHPQRFIQGTATDVQAYPDSFFATGEGIYLAHGRDPNFPPWTDTVQLNFYATDLRQALIKELMRIAEVADGVRCDMAMLSLNNIFENIWGRLARYPRPETEFWAEAITRVKQRRPGFLFLAEVYWGLERQLQQLGFDFTYNKAFYDRLRFSEAKDIRNQLMMDEPHQQHLVRFIENHDEERAVNAFGRKRSLAAAAIIGTIPGLRLFQDGQFEGYRIRLPVQMVREPEEAAEPDITHFYEALLTVCNLPQFHEGEWRLLEVSQAGEGTDSPGLLAWCWQYREQFKIVVVNYSLKQAQGWLKLPPPESLRGDISNEPGSGLHVDLEPWEAQIIDMNFGSYGWKFLGVYLLGNYSDIYYNVVNQAEGDKRPPDSLTIPILAKEGTGMAQIIKPVADKWLGDVAQDKQFWCRDGRTLKNLPELEVALIQMTEETFRYHSNEAKNDFSKWVRDVIGDEELSQALQRSTSRLQAAKIVADRISWLQSR